MDLAVAQVVVEDVQHGVLAQQGGIELDEGVQPSLRQHVAGDGLDLVGWAAMHGGQGDRVGELGGDGEFGNQGIGDLGLELGDLDRGVFHMGHKALHRLAQDALQVVADAHVEDCAKRCA